MTKVEIVDSIKKCKLFISTGMIAKERNYSKSDNGQVLRF